MMNREEQVKKNLELARRHLERTLARPGELQAIPSGASVVLTDHQNDPELSQENEALARRRVAASTKKVVVIDIGALDSGVLSERAELTETPQLPVAAARTFSAGRRTTTTTHIRRAGSGQFEVVREHKPAAKTTPKSASKAGRRGVRRSGRRDE